MNKKQLTDLSLSAVAGSIMVLLILSWLHQAGTTWQPVPIRNPSQSSAERLDDLQELSIYGY